MRLQVKDQYSCYIVEPMDTAHEIDPRCRLRGTGGSPPCAFKQKTTVDFRGLFSNEFSNAASALGTLVLGIAEAEDQHEDRAEQNQANAETYALAKSFCELIGRQNTDNERDQSNNRAQC